jgi:hemoglobin
MATPTLYELAGGRLGVHRLCEAFYARVLADPLLLPLFRDPADEHAERLAMWLTESLGGPAEHSAHRGGPAVMEGSHHGLRISEAQRARWASHMRAACADVGMPKAFVDRFRPFVDGGSTFAMRVSHPADQRRPR